jgi:PAS domain S-box-containing protein
VQDSSSHSHRKGVVPSSLNSSRRRRSSSFAWRNVTSFAAARSALRFSGTAASTAATLPNGHEHTVCRVYGNAHVCLGIIRGDVIQDALPDRTIDAEYERQLLDAIVRQVPVGLIAVDHEGRPLLLNDEAARILGRPDAIAEADWRPAGEEDATGGPLTSALLHGSIVSSERFELRRADGGERFVEVSATPVRDQAGRIIAAVVTLVDLTQRVIHEQAQRDFITNAAHELQSPLAAIVSAAEVLQSGAKDSADRDLFLGHIEREAGRLTTLVRSLLTLARAQTGHESPRADVVALEPVIKSVAESLDVGPDVALSVSCPPELAVLGNADLICHVLDNLARNAAKFTTSGSISIDAQALDGTVEIAVADTGPGIPAEEHARAFDRFYRGESAEGFGLGLAIAESVTEALGGELTLVSEEGRGTALLLRLPAAAELV